MSTPRPLDWSAARRDDGAIELWFSDGRGATLVTLPLDQARVLTSVVEALVGTNPEERVA